MDRSTTVKHEGYVRYLLCRKTR